LINIPALATICFLSATGAAAASADNPTLVTGTIVAIDPQGDWELGALDAREGHWLYPYAAAMIRVAEATPDSTASGLAAGDTVAVWHVTTPVARNSARPGEALESSAIADQVAGRKLRVGQSAVFRLRYRLGRWFFDPQAVEAKSE